MRSSLTCVAGWLTLFLAVVCADPVTTVYKKEGDEVVLKPGVVPVSDTITSIMWRDGPNIAIQWDGEETDSYRQFKERGTLNTATGEMTITGLTPNDSGLYTPEINNVVLSPTLLQVIAPVPEPTASEPCGDKRTICTLTCDGNATDAYTTCCCSPTPRQEGKANISTGVTVFTCLLVALLLLVAVHRCKAGMWFFQKTSMPWEADFWRKDERPSRDAAESNGTTTPEKKQQDEETPMI